MKKFIEKLRNSSFIINKLYLIIVFILIFLESITLGAYSFIISIIVFGIKILKSKIPMKVEEDVEFKTYVYKDIDNKSLKMDIYYPNTVKEKYPLVYFCHGGGWISGFRNQPNNVSWCKYLASKGFCTASIDYRFGYKNSMMDILSDYSDGLQYIKDKHESLKIDKDHIVLMGLSAGGHLSLLYATYHTSVNPKGKCMEGVKAVVGYYPPTQLEDLLDEDNKSLFAKFAISKTLKTDNEEDDPVEIDKIYNFYSPITYLTENMVPTLIVHGKMDNTVPYSSSVKFVDRLNELKVPNEFLTHKKADHSFDSRLDDFTTVNIIDKTAKFIKSHIN